MTHEHALLWAAFCAGATVATLICWIGQHLLGPPRPVPGAKGGDDGR
jgi:hypothetical protein